MTAGIGVLVTWSAYTALIALSVALVMVFVRLLLGPSLPDRIVALDTIAYLAIGFCAVWAVVTGHDAFLDAAATLALISFLATIALSRHVHARARDPEARQ
jgi:multicomponent Na+:H+ antiporter subunit F